MKRRIRRARNEVRKQWIAAGFREVARAKHQGGAIFEREADKSHRWAWKEKKKT